MHKILHQMLGAQSAFSFAAKGAWSVAQYLSSTGPAVAFFFELLTDVSVAARLVCNQHSSYKSNVLAFLVFFGTKSYGADVIPQNERGGHGEQARVVAPALPVECCCRQTVLSLAIPQLQHELTMNVLLLHAAAADIATSSKAFVSSARRQKLVWRLSCIKQCTQDATYQQCAGHIARYISHYAFCLRRQAVTP